MHAQGQDRPSGPGPAATPARPAPALPPLLALQRAAGNAAVSRAIQLARHEHGPGCGHGTPPDPRPSRESPEREREREPSRDSPEQEQEPGPRPAVQRCCADHDPEPAVQRRSAPPDPYQPSFQRRSSAFDAIRSPGAPLAPHILHRAQQAYGEDFSHVRVHSDAVARKSALEYGALAYTTGSSIVVSRASLDDETMFHEVDHVRQQMRGAVAGTDDGSGARVSHPDDPFERSAAANGRRVAQGRAPDLSHPSGHTAGASVQLAPAAPSVQRAPAGTKAKAEAGKRSSEAEWERRANKVAELVKQCTCEQTMKQWGRVDPKVMVRHTRSYKHQPDEQSLRHAVRRVYRAVSWLEKQAKEQAKEKGTGKGKQPATAEDAATAAATEKARKTEDEIEGMLFNGHLAFASNLNATVHALHRHLLSLGDRPSDAEDAHGEALRETLLHDFDKEDGHEADDERPESSATGGKRQAPGGDQKGSKRQKTGKDPAEPRLGSSTGPAEQRKRDRRARRKLTQGLIASPRVEGMPELPPEAEMFTRDNATTRALRNVRWVRKVDISNERAKDPAYREYLAQLLSTSNAEHGKYAFLLHNGDNDEVLHAEQKLLLFIHNAGITKDTPHDPVLIRGLKRPCKACLALLDYFRTELGIDVRYNPNGGHFFQNALRTIAQNFPGAFARTVGGDQNWFARNMTDERPMYASSITGVVPGSEAEVGNEGGLQEPLTLEVNGDKRNYPRNAQVVATMDSGSSSDDEGNASAPNVSGLVRATGGLSLTGPPTAPSAPPVNREAQQAQAQSAFEREVAAPLNAAMPARFRAEWEKRPPKGGGKFEAKFPEELRTTIRDLMARKVTSQARIAQHLKMSSPALGKQLGDKTPKQAENIKAYPEKIEALKAAMPPDFRAEWERLTEAGEYWAPDYSRPFRRLLYETVASGISWTSVAEFMRIKPSTFKARWDDMKKEWGDPKEDRGEGPSGT